MTTAGGPGSPMPSFTAPLDPPRFVRRVTLEPYQATDSVTAQRDLFVLAHLGVPQVDAAQWRLEIGGLVDRPLTLALDDIRRLPSRQVESFHQCAGFPRRADLAVRRVANVVWSGVDLADLLQTCGVGPDARFLWAYGLDHGHYDGVTAKWYVKDVPLSRLTDGGVLLAYAVNGEPLTPEHGFPLRLIVPGYYGTNSVKWLWRIELAQGRATGPFTTELYNDPNPSTGGTRPVWDAPPESLIVAPAPGPIPAAPLTIWGWAWAAAGVAKVDVSVDVSVDGNETWLPARLEPRQQWSWQRFALDWQPAGTGSFTLAARATDTRGAIQPMQKARNAVHTVAISVA
jgi:DMSO/TMAO reductase YedYZ molybdopterin-dependent catalytic subunit